MIASIVRERLRWVWYCYRGSILREPEEKEREQEPKECRGSLEGKILEKVREEATLGA